MFTQAQLHQSFPLLRLAESFAAKANLVAGEKASLLADKSNLLAGKSSLVSKVGEQFMQREHAFAEIHKRHVQLERIGSQINARFEEQEKIEALVEEAAKALQADDFTGAVGFNLEETLKGVALAELERVGLIKRRR